MIKKILKYVTYLVLTISFLAVLQIDVLGNFYKVNDGVFRSGQLNKYNLDYYANKHNIKTIINLRGKITAKAYVDEVKLSKKLGINLVDYEMWNSKYLDFNKTSLIVQMLKDVEKPILIHCYGGADRTSLVSALYQYGIAGKTEAIAREEFSFMYGHIPYYRKKVIAMDNSFDNYVEQIKKKNK